MIQRARKPVKALSIPIRLDGRVFDVLIDTEGSGNYISKSILNAELFFIVKIKTPTVITLGNGTTTKVSASI